MGHPTEIFIPPPPDGFICAVCMDVLESAKSFSCGHSFCGGCCSRVTAAPEAVCPTCRAKADDAKPNYAMRDVVDGLTVRCPEYGGRGDGRKRKRDEADEEGGEATAGGGCEWTGPLRDLDEHRKPCGHAMVSCALEGCNHGCRRKDMEAHLSGGASLLRHMQLMQASQDARHEEAIQALRTKYESRITTLKRASANYDSKIKSLEEDAIIRAIHEKCAKECRRWIDYRPDALHGVKVYPLTVAANRLFSHKYVMEGFECHIPGPSNTPWEGATLRAEIRYRDREKPPKCSFVPPLFHVNVYPSGTISMTAINEEESWDPNTTLHEIIFTIQQLLGHPNCVSPAQTEAYNVYIKRDGGYEARIKSEIAEKWSDVRPPDDGRLDITELAKKKLRAFGKKTDLQEQERPIVPTFDRDENGKPIKQNYHPRLPDCECSCCAWGQKFYDDKGKMRFLFGVGG